MYTIAVVIIICTLLVLVFRSFTQKVKQINLNDMITLYDKMELYVYTHNLQNNEHIKDFLYPYKYYIENNDYSELESILDESDQEKSKVTSYAETAFSSTAKNIPLELHDLSQEYVKHLISIIRLSGVGVGFYYFSAILFSIILLMAVFWLPFKSMRAKVNRVWMSLFKSPSPLEYSL